VSAVHIATKLITAPTVEPFTVDEAKSHCRIDLDDTNIVKWIKAARTKVEQDTGRALLPQTWDLFLDAPWPTAVHWSTLPWPSCAFSGIDVPYPPLASVTSINVTDPSGAETVWNASNYLVDTASEPGRIALSDTGTWPTNLRMFQPIRVRFVAGWATPLLIPSDLLQAMALWVGWFSEHREPSAVEGDSYDGLIAQYVQFAAA
jgi:uncharacterized phiE125 gp8 family phage protein